jgi:aspartate/methionine/tyrosine aminotransferase
MLQLVRKLTNQIQTMSFLSKRLNYFDSSDFRNAFYKQQHLENPIDLSVGVPEELTPEHVKQAGILAIQNNKTVYTPANGLLELREAIANKFQTDNGISCNADTITILPGLTTGQLLIYLAILDPGDEIIILDPYYPPYPHLASTIGAHVQLVSTLPTFQPDIEAIESAITNRTKAIVINSPNNPTGAVYPKETLLKIASIADKHNILIISDEIYEHFTYDEPHYSIGSSYENTITLNGFSKEYAMTGWRLGYMTGPLEIIEAINELLQYIVFSSSSIAQHAAVAALKQRPNITDKYRVKRDLLIKGLKNQGYEIHGAQGAYYVFVQAPNDMTDIDFVDIAAEHNLIILPGRAFSSRHGYVRISYGAATQEIEKGIEILNIISNFKK